MSQAPQRLLVRCDDCSKVYRVPDVGRTPACRACGGSTTPLQAKAAHADHGAAELVLCNDCQALNARDEEACLECGADLAGATVVESEEEAADHLEAAKQAFRRASRWSTGIAWTYHLGAAAYAIAALFAVLALRRLDVPVGGGVLVVSLLVFLSVLMGTAALHLLFAPFLWTLSVAVLATAVALVHAVGPNPYGAALFGSAAWALLSWALLVPARKLQAGIEHHKDLYILHHASVETKRLVKGRSPGERHARLLGAMRRADRRAWKLSAAAALLLVVATTIGANAVVTGLRPQPFDGALAAFERTWNAGAPDDVVPLFDARVREAEGIWFGAVAAGYGWVDDLPTLSGGAREEGQGECAVAYDLGELTLTARFVMRDLEWQLAKVELPYPPLEPTLARFRGAWDAGDTEALAAFFSPENRETMQANLDETRVARGWERFPPVVGIELKGVAERNASADVDIGLRKAVETRWFFRNDGAWGLLSLELPKWRAPRPDEGSE